jgi:UDP-glucose 4-epimerase
MSTYLVTGAKGFIGEYLVRELLDHGHRVVGVDDFSKYGPSHSSFDDDPRFDFVQADVSDMSTWNGLLDDVDVLIAGAALIGGISYFHTRPFDILAKNEEIMAQTMRAAIGAHQAGSLQRVVVVSSSMVYESATSFPSVEGDELRIAPPLSSYGFQKLATEYFARAAYDQFGLPYVIVRPFNCVGIGERRSKFEAVIDSGGVSLALSHVVPDLVQKILRGQDPLHILGNGNQVRCYTYGGDLARGIRLASESDAALLEDFNLSTPVATSVRELAEMIWHKVKGTGEELRIQEDPPFEHDVQFRLPGTHKAQEVLGFTAETSLDEVLDEVIPWVADAIERGDI